MSTTSPTPGSTWRRGEAGYEQARRATMWNADVPDRYPDVIVQANTDDDAVAAVKHAAAAGMRIAVRSGGHNWAGNHVRDGGLLLDLSRLKTMTVDETAMRAVASAGVGGSEVALALAARGLFFPAGHCLGVCIGGYLLQGGFGWNGRVLGPACMSVAGIDYIDPEGVVRHASETENSEMLWAARGAGPAFFGVVLRFHLRLYPMPRFVGIAAATYSIDRFDDVFSWARTTGPDVAPEVDLNLMTSRAAKLVRGQGIEVLSPVFADSRRQARAATSFMSSRPRGANLVVPLTKVPLSFLYRGVMTHYPSATSWKVDNMWTHASYDELRPGLERIVETMPGRPSHMLWMNWMPRGARPDMAFSTEDDIYISLYGGWTDPAQAARTAAWAPSRMAEMAHLSTGSQLADDPGRPARVLAQPNLERLEALRSLQDPDDRFHRWIGHA
jgi:FAD/FMN-containing dehydrogenase